MADDPKPSSSFGIPQIIALVAIVVVVGLAVWGSRSTTDKNLSAPVDTARPGKTDSPASADGGTKDAGAKKAGDSGTAETADALAKRLVGRWQRYEDPYVLEIRSVKPEGKLDVGYFNPRPINVSKAEYSTTDGKLFVFVELRDTNYPGATYKLSYDSASDRLSGFYHQPISDQTYEIFFVRQQE